MGKKLTVLIILSLIEYSKAQNIEQGQRSGLVKGTASFYKGITTNETNGSYVYLGGNLEYFMTDLYSIRGNGYYLIQQGKGSFESNQGSFLLNIGFNRYFPKGRWSPFIGTFTGITYYRETSDQLVNMMMLYPTSAIIPNFGLIGGVQFYVFDYFHFFAEAGYLYQLNPFHNRTNDQILISAGLGFNLPTKK